MHSDFAAHTTARATVVILSECILTDKTKQSNSVLHTVIVLLFEPSLSEQETKNLVSAHHGILRKVYPERKRRTLDDRVVLMPMIGETLG